MRIKILLFPHQPVFLTFSYYHHLSSALYEVLGGVDPDFSREIHHGATHRNRIKLFNFSPLNSKAIQIVRKGEIGREDGGLVFKGLTSFCISSPSAEIIRRWFAGIKNIQQLRVGSQAFWVKKVEFLEIPDFQSEMIWVPVRNAGVVNAWTPIAGSGKRYLMPRQEFEGMTAETLLADNLVHKWRRLTETYPEVAKAWATGENMTLKEKKVHVHIENRLRGDEFVHKAHLIKSTYVRSWAAPVRIVAPMSIQRLVWTCGLGEMNSMGFGMVDVERRS